mmetsp:Transcript_27868/g.85491  ORF Transcript_27868/g.85491 Transcript_27868/m.85491 type:complete len:202 (-) Transcript_27868:383-988(-)
MMRADAVPDQRREFLREQLVVAGEEPRLVLRDRVRAAARSAIGFLRVVVGIRAVVVRVVFEEFAGEDVDEEAVRVVGPLPPAVVPAVDVDVASLGGAFFRAAIDVAAVEVRQSQYQFHAGGTALDASCQVVGAFFFVRRVAIEVVLASKPRVPSAESEFSDSVIIFGQRATRLRDRALPLNDSLDARHRRRRLPRRRESHS